jgi:hypothetical protein
LWAPRRFDAAIVARARRELLSLAVDLLPAP